MDAPHEGRPLHRRALEPAQQAQPNFIVLPAQIPRIEGPRNRRAPPMDQHPLSAEWKCLQRMMRQLVCRHMRQLDDVLVDYSSIRAIAPCDLAAVGERRIDDVDDVGTIAPARG